MLRITPSGSADGVKDYFRRGLSRGEYYSKGLALDQELVGGWGGLGAERLGLTGPVTQEAFNTLCDNRHPGTDRPLTPRTKEGRRVAYDFNFHAPKSVSCLLELGGDTRIAGAFQDAVRATMEEIERDTQTRVRVDNQNGSRQTSNMIWAEFLHFTARPVDGVPDPHLHQHVVVFNQTWDPVESRWKAIDVGDIKRDAPYFQAAFHARLAENLRELGYGIERSADGWEIAGVPASMIRSFSRRRDEIERVADELGITDAARKAELGATTRQRKAADLSMTELRTAWQGRLTDDERAALNTVLTARGKDERVRPDQDLASSLAIDHAIRHSFERQSVVSERRLLAAALEQGVGGVTPDSVAQELAKRTADGRVLTGEHDGQRMVTTRAVLAEEQAMLSAVRDGRGRHAPLQSEHTFLDDELSEEQRHAVTHALTSPDSTVAITGRAGVGKTRVMKEIVAAIESTGREVFVAAPTAMATHETLRADGFDASTVASLLHDPGTPAAIRGQAVWVDEAGLLSAPDMAKLVSLTHENDARLILTGDTRQHRSVSRGDALRLLESESGVVPAEITAVRRQVVPEYRQAAESLARGSFDEGFDRLDRLGAIREIEDAERAGELAACYAESVREGRTTLVIAPTHAEGRSVTAAIRERLQASNVIENNEQAVERLQGLNLTEAERADPARYREGDVVRFAQNVAGGFRRGDRAAVVGVGEGRVGIERARDGRRVDLPLDRSDRFDVYRKDRLSIASGDQIRITRNGLCADGKHRLHNGAIYAVDRVHPDGSLTIQNGWRIAKDFGHLTHGYCVTSDASQGRTVDHVLIAQSAESAGASNKQQFYTSVTRGRHRVTVFTDDKQRLRRSIARDASRLTATELLRTQAALPPERGLQHRRSIGRWIQERLGLRQRQQASERGLDQHRAAAPPRRGRGVNLGRERGGRER